jgi:hypothetical protein
MSVLLFVVGAIATVAGVGMVGYGIPINEFSFGNTLIVAGTTLAVGGLVIIAIGAAVSKLQQITEAITARSPRRLELFEHPGSTRAAPMQDRIPFPPRTKAAPPRSELPPVETSTAAEVPADENAVASTAPVLRNPDVPLAERREVKEYEEISLSPRQPTAAPGEYAKEQPTLPPAPPVMEKRAGPAIDAPLRSPPRGRPHTTSFDAVWPPESRASRAAQETKPEPQPEPPQADVVREEPGEPAILKSGVVDGMGYTLYVDGSIEAELPQGTLRFASINELREHLAKNS